ncbi:MAG: glycosyltransferase family 9 protein [Thauera sp.]|nr:glycosyltransferase family 9 protein [Thauera sp.]
MRPAWVSAAEGPYGPVERIAVLRSTGVGDFVFALPALSALRARYPRACVVLLGRPWHRRFLSGRTPLVDEVVVLPPIPGVGAAPDTPCDPRAIEAFCAGLRHRRFDLAFQFFGGGRYSNPFLRRVGARHSFGPCAPGAQPLEHSMPYVDWQNERLRLLEVVALAGAHNIDLEPRLPVLPRDRAELAERVELPSAPLAVLAPGATDPRRRWPAERFAAVGDALAEAGAVVAVQGDGNERALTAGIVAAMRHPALDLGGLLSLDGLAALLERARLVVANDSGPLHLAQAVGAATVGLYWLTNLFNSAPPTVTRHRYLASCRVICPVCGEENLEHRCPHDPSFIADIGLDEVREAALALWRQEGGAEAAPASRS